MKTRIAVALTMVVAAGLPAPARAQGAFEGVITFNMEAGRGPTTMQYSIKGPNVRMDMSMGGGMAVYTLFNTDTKTMDMVMPERQMYMEYSAANMPAMADSIASKAKLTWTGQKETIAGYECEHAMIASDSGSTDVCLAKGLGSFVPAGGGMRGRGAMRNGWESAVAGMFPLKVQQGDRVLMEATKIEKKTLDPSLFAVPAGYQKMGMGGMGMGRRGGGGGR
jgi:Domain of unknown function (DUF4412)